MEYYTVGDVVGECPGVPGQSCGGTVQYKGGSDAQCQTCGATFTVNFEENESSDPPPPPPPPPQPEPQKPKPKPPEKPQYEDVGKLTSSVTGVSKENLQLERDAKNVTAHPDLGVDVPPYIRKSREWRWAHKMSMTGCPYKEGTKAGITYLLFQGAGCTIEEAFEKAGKDPVLNTGRLSYLLTLYEVVVNCICAGLLVRDEKGVIKIWNGTPVPHPMP